MYTCSSGHGASIFSLLQKRQNVHAKSPHQEFITFSKLLLPKFQHVNSFATEEDHLACDLTFSPDGRIITSGGYCGEVCGHDSVTGKQIFHQYAAHHDIVNEVLYINGQQFATASSDRTAKLWDVRKTSFPVLSFMGHKGPIKSLAFDEDASKLLTTSMDGTICWWNVSQAKQEDNLVLKCADLNLSSYSAKHDIFVFSTTSMLFVIKDVDLMHVYNDLKAFWERGVFTADFREHGTWVSSLQDKERNSVTALTDDECTPIPNSKTKGFHSLVIHPTKKAIIAGISVQQDLFGSASEHVVFYDVSRYTKANNGVKKLEPLIEHLFSAGEEITHHKVRYYSPLKVFRRSQVPTEVVNRQKKFDISKCGRVIAVPNVDKVNLLATSATINEPFEDVRTEAACSTASGWLEFISDGSPRMLCNICELPVAKGTIPICCKFSPNDMLLAVNGFGHQLSLYQPRL